MKSHSKSSAWVSVAFPFLLAVLAYFWPQYQALVRVAPADFKCLHYGLSSQSGLYDDQPDWLEFANQPQASLEEYLTRGRTLYVDGEEWRTLFQVVPDVIGRNCWELDTELCRRTSPREDDWVNGLFYRATETPFSALPQLPSPGEYVYLYLKGDREAEPLQLLSVGPDDREGSVYGCRWYYDSWQIPTAFSHPYRRYTPWLIVFGILWPLRGLIARATNSLKDRRDAIDPRLVNFRKRSARISLAVTAGMLALGIGYIWNDPYADYVPPLVFVGGFLVIMGMITTGILWRSALRQDRMFSGDLLARWEYPQDEWRRQVEARFRERSAASRAMLTLVGVLMLLIGGGFVAIVRDEASVIVAAVLACIFVLLILVALIAPARQRRFLLSRPGLVLISRSVVYLGGEFHDFQVFGTQITGAELEQGEGDEGSTLRIQYAYQTRAGTQTTTLAIAVPKGKESEAKNAANTLNREAESFGE